MGRNLEGVDAFPFLLAHFDVDAGPRSADVDCFLFLIFSVLVGAWPKVIAATRLAPNALCGVQLTSRVSLSVSAIKAQKQKQG